MDSRLKRRFKELSAGGEKALIAYVTAGDPSLDTTRRAILALHKAGADIIEVGIPFSDPLLDGPVIQAASHRALEHGTKLSAVLDMVRSVRSESDVPMLFMTCMNPIASKGQARFAAAAKQAGIDAVLITDLPPEEGAEWVSISRDEGLDTIFMLAPTSSPARIRAVAEAASGFIYCQSRAGVTGEQRDVPPDLGILIDRVRAASALPVAVGFGISRPEHVRAVSAVADGAVVGSAFVRLLAEAGVEPDAGVRAAAELAADLKAATRP